VADLHAHDSAALGVGRQLHIDRRMEPPVGHLHHPRFRIARAHPRLLVPDLLPTLSLARPLGRFRLLLFQFRQLQEYKKCCV
jgi:hypothetical protein